MDPRDSRNAGWLVRGAEDFLDPRLLLVFEPALYVWMRGKRAKLVCNIDGVRQALAALWAIAA